MSNYDTHLARIYEVLQPYLPEGETLSEDSELVSDLGLSSIDVMEMIVEIEDHFDISIPLNILPGISTVGDLATALGKLDQE
jgi:acyl carrier protein